MQGTALSAAIFSFFTLLGEKKKRISATIAGACIQEFVRTSYKKNESTANVRRAENNQIEDFNPLTTTQLKSRNLLKYHIIPNQVSLQ